MDSSVDKLIDDIGFGKWQIICATTVCLFQITSTFQYINTVFVNMPNVTSCFCVSHQNLSQEERGYYHYELNSSEITQYGYNFSQKESAYYQYKLNNSEITEYGDNCESTSPYIDSFIYDNTFPKEFGLIGDKAWISSLYQIIFMLGIILGNIASAMSDFIGRLTIIRWGLVGYLVGTLLVSLSPDIYVILISRFIIGFTHELYESPALTLLIEITPVKQRSVIGNMVMVPNALGGVLAGGLAYLIRPWRLFHLVSSVPVLLLAICTIYITKSPRWLLTQNSLEEAADVIEKAAKMNKGKVPSRDNLMSILYTVVENSETIQKSKETSNRSKVQQTVDFLQLFFTSPSMCRVSLITPVLWMVVGLLYYGITLNANNFAANIYVYITVLHLFDVFPIFCTSFLINRIGNILTSTILFVSAGLCLLGVIILPEIWWIKWPLVVIAFMASGGSFDLCFIMVNELYPTIVRSSGSAFCSLTGNIGTLLASYLFETVAQKIWWVPNSVCVVFCLLATVLLQLLPETNGQPLCETVEQVEQRGVKTKFKSVSENIQQNVLRDTSV